MDSKEKNLNYFAVVIGDWHFNTLGMVRSLGEMGIRVVFINLSEGGYAQSSRYTEKTLYAENGEDIINHIINTVREYGKKAVLFPSGDTAALYIDENRIRLADYCICPGFDGNIASFMDKENMCALAKESGFNVPEFLNLKIESGFEEKLRAFPLPLIIKPLKSVDGSKADIMICTDESTRADAVKTLSSSESGYKEVLVQQFVHGKENLMVEYCGCKSHGRKISVFGQLEKIREYPVNRGSTTFAVIKEEITHIDVDVLDTFLEKSGFCGLFDLELKIVDGVPYFLEINYRNGAPSYGFTKAGFNVPYTWFCEQTGNTAGNIAFKEIYLMSERDDLNNVKDKNIGIFRWIKDIRRTDTMMIFNKNDPQPFKDSYNPVICKIFSILQK